MQHLDQMLVSLRRVGLLKLNIRGRFSMSQKLFNLNDDLRQLREAGYHVANYCRLPCYERGTLCKVNAFTKGTALTSLDLAGDNTQTWVSCHALGWGISL